MQDSKTLKQEIEEILREAFGDRPIPSRTTETVARAKAEGRPYAVITEKGRTEYNRGRVVRFVPSEA
jgi:hypothetical protein